MAMSYHGPLSHNQSEHADTERHKCRRFRDSRCHINLRVARQNERILEPRRIVDACRWMRRKRNMDRVQWSRGRKLKTDKPQSNRLTVCQRDIGIGWRVVVSSADRLSASPDSQVDIGTVQRIPCEYVRE